MDILDKKNKEITGAEPDAKNKAEETVVGSIVAASALTQRYFYPPQDGYAAISVVAPDREQADLAYKQQRQPAQQEQKVEEPKNSQE